MGSAKPAILGGEPVSHAGIPFTRPSLASGPDLTAQLGDVVASGSLTKGSHLRHLEEEVAQFLGVRNAVLVSSGTVGLMLVLRCLELSGAVALPSFTFMASGHAVRWNGLEVRFADIDPGTFTLAPQAAAAALGADTAAVMAVHTFGVATDADALQAVAAGRGLPLILDAAHGFGGTYPDGTMIGSKGLAEVFSLSPTKAFTCGEGGLITTGDDALAARLRIAREYGNPGDFDSLFAGLNGRMPETSALIGRHCLPHVPRWIAERGEVAQLYRTGLKGLDGLEFQQIPDGTTSTYKDLSILVDPARFGVDRDTTALALAQENIDTRRYFFPPLHRQTAYRDDSARWDLPVTDQVADRVLALPMFSAMTAEQVEQVCDGLQRIAAHAGEVAAAAQRCTPPFRAAGPARQSPQPGRSRPAEYGEKS